MTEECLFCSIAEGKVPGEKIHESQNFIVIKDAYPKTQGHSLVIPKGHYETFGNIPNELYEELLVTTREALTKILQEAGTPEYNLLSNNGKSAGQMVNHFHLHILPRKEGTQVALTEPIANTQ